MFPWSRSHHSPVISSKSKQSFRLQTASDIVGIRDQKKLSVGMPHCSNNWANAMHFGLWAWNGVQCVQFQGYSASIMMQTPDIMQILNLQLSLQVTDSISNCLQLPQERFFRLDRILYTKNRPESRWTSQSGWQLTHAFSQFYLPISLTMGRTKLYLKSIVCCCCHHFAHLVMSVEMLVDCHHHWCQVFYDSENSILGVSQEQINSYRN